MRSWTVVVAFAVALGSGCGGRVLPFDSDAGGGWFVDADAIADGAAGEAGSEQSDAAVGFDASRRDAAGPAPDSGDARDGGDALDAAVDVADVVVDSGPLVCDADASACAGQCVDTETDPLHCGSCANGCHGGVCNAGVCGPAAVHVATGPIRGLAADDSHVYWAESDLVAAAPDGSSAYVLMKDVDLVLGLTAQSGYVGWASHRDVELFDVAAGVHRPLISNPTGETINDVVFGPSIDPDPVTGARSLSLDWTMNGSQPDTGNIASLRDVTKYTFASGPIHFAGVPDQLAFAGDYTFYSDSQNFTITVHRWSTNSHVVMKGYTQADVPIDMAYREPLLYLTMPSGTLRTLNMTGGNAPVVPGGASTILADDSGVYWIDIPAGRVFGLIGNATTPTVLADATGGLAKWLALGHDSVYFVDGVSAGFGTIRRAKKP